MTGIRKCATSRFFATPGANAAASEQTTTASSGFTIREAGWDGNGDSSFFLRWGLGRRGVVPHHPTPNHYPRQWLTPPTSRLMDEYQETGYEPRTKGTAECKGTSERSQHRRVVRAPMGGDDSGGQGCGVRGVANERIAPGDAVTGGRGECHSSSNPLMMCFFDSPAYL